MQWIHALILDIFVLIFSHMNEIVCMKVYSQGQEVESYELRII